MKEYVKPTFEYVQLNINERLACGPSVNPWQSIFDGWKQFLWSWNWGWHWEPCKPDPKPCRDSRGDRFHR